MTKEEFEALRDRFFKAAQLQNGIFQCEEKLKAIENSGPHTYDDIRHELRELLPEDLIDEWIGDMKERAKRILRGQIKLLEQKFNEL